MNTVKYWCKREAANLRTLIWQFRLILGHGHRCNYYDGGIYVGVCRTPGMHRGSA